MICQRLSWVLALCMVLFLKVRVEASPYLATVVKLPGLASLIPPQPPAPAGYAVFFYDLGDMREGATVAQVSPLYSQHAVYVAPARKNGRFLLLANTGSGTEIFRYSAVRQGHWKPLRKFPRKIIPINTLTSPLMVGDDGTVWIWFGSTSVKSEMLEIFSPHLKRRLGVCVLPQDHFYSEMAMVGKRAVVFTASVPVIQGSPHYQIRVVQENGHTQHITNEVGTWPPRYLSAVGNLVTGIGTSGATVGDLLEFTVDKASGVSGMRAFSLLNRKNLRIGPYTSLDADTGVCVLPVSKGHHRRLTYEMARISLKNGTIERTTPLDYPVYNVFDFNSLFVWHGRIFILAASGTIHAYTSDLRHIGSRSPVAPWLSNFAISAPK